MNKLLNKKVTIKHHTNVLYEPTELTKHLEVEVWDVREHDENFVMINGGWLLPIEEANSIILGEK